jgi:anaerobic magnesium-protoporphyrin IX monomethyl ester cyclase
MTDIVLVNPAAAHGIYGPLGQTLVAVEPPTWLRLTAGYLRGRGYDVVVIDAERGKHTPAEVARRIEIFDPRLVGLVVFGHMPSAATQQMHGAREVAKAIKLRNPARVIAIAGGHVSALPERTLREEPVDFAIKGEGPITFEWLLRDYDGLGTINADPGVLSEAPGLVWKAPSGAIIVNPPASALDPDHDLTDQGWDLTPPAGYVCHNWQALGYPEAARSPYASVITSFNCPFACSFCQIRTPFGAPGYKTRSPSSVVDEIEYLVKEHGVHFIKFVDEMYLLKPSHYMPIAQGLIDRGLGDKINIWCYGRVDSVKPDTLGLLRRSGVRWIALGIESGDPSIRDGAEKRLREDDIVGVVRSIQDAGINVVGNFMFGFRGDDRATMRRTLDLALECLPEWTNFYTTMALPGSALYDQALIEGWTLPDTWAGFSQHNRHCRPLDTLHVDAATVLRTRDEAFCEYFSAPAYRALVQRRFGPAAVAQVDAMLEYRLERDLLGGAA